MVKADLDMNPENTLLSFKDTKYDKTHKMIRKKATPYLLMMLDDHLVWAMRDSGSNFTSITVKTAQDLNLWREDFNGVFAMADGTTRKFEGIIPKATLRLHDFLTVEVHNLRVLPGAFSQVIVGQDIFTFNAHNPHLREVGAQKDGADQLLKVELGKERNGVELAIPLHFAGTPQEQGGGGL